MSECLFSSSEDGEGFHGKAGHSSGDWLSLIQSLVLVACSHHTAPGAMAPEWRSCWRLADPLFLNPDLSGSSSRTLRREEQWWEHPGLAVGQESSIPKPERGANQQHSDLSSALQSVLRLSCVVTMETKKDKAAACCWHPKENVTSRVLSSSEVHIKFF